MGVATGLVWRPTSPGNEDVLICINAPYMTQRVLKPWWQWTNQNSAVKRAAARAIPGWVTSWEIWYGEPKADNIVSLGVGRYKWYQSHCPAWDGGSVHKPKEGCRRALAGMPRMGGSHEGRQRGRWVPRGGDCDVPHRLGMRMCLYV
jgi:hypothetical protein